MTAHTYGVIIAGGKGTRFWPLSRSRRPKQLLKILSGRSLIRETADRLLPLCGRAKTLVVTVAEQLDATRKELRSIPKNNFLAEPRGNNTAPCIGLAALEIASRDPAAVMVVLPADHWISDARAFRRILTRAVELTVNRDRLITIGIRPGYPETGYGYIVKGRRLRNFHGAAAFQVERFKEKPSLGETQRLLRRRALWNGGIFVWKASTLLEMLRRYQPAIFKGLEKIAAAANGKPLASPRLRAIVAREYKKMASISIDHAVLEKAGSEGRVLTVEASFGWSDVGSWEALHRMLPHDRDGNAGLGKWLGYDATNCLVHASDRLVVLLGIRDAVVVDTSDALLVCDLKRSQEVRELVEKLKRSGYSARILK